MTSFVYSDEQDKSYGLTGMVISLNVLDKTEMLREISLDNASGESIMFTPDFDFIGNPRLSAKIAWNEMVRQLQVMTGMVVGNVLCRTRVYRHKIETKQTLADMRSLVEEEGKNVCELEADEVDAIFDKTYRYMSNLYSNPEVLDIARGFSKALITRRTMSGNEVIEQIEILRRR